MALRQLKYRLSVQLQMVINVPNHYVFAVSMGFTVQNLEVRNYLMATQSVICAALEYNAHQLELYCKKS